MRLLHIDTGREMRGGQWQVLYLLERLAAAGHNITLLARLGSPLYQKAKEQALDVRPATVVSVPELSWDADLVHVHDARSHTLAALAALRPVVVSRRVAFPVKTHFLSRWKYKRAARYIAVSEYVKSRLAAAGIAGDRISVVYDGVPVGSGPVAAGGGIVVAPATNDLRKGTALVKAAAALAQVDVRFSADLARDLPDAAAFVYITHEEGLGSGALLAMAAGVPVIASRIGGLTEIIEDGETGLLVENTAEAIAGAIERVLGDPALRARLAAAARQCAIERFSVDRMVRETLAVYHRVLPC
jgi:glycosyltransferase involved in cell wall biosynthesis